ncbi:hypothetical protein ACJBU6_01985 [Exserohilum turcicum]
MTRHLRIWLLCISLYHVNTRTYLRSPHSSYKYPNPGLGLWKSFKGHMCSVKLTCRTRTELAAVVTISQHVIRSEGEYPSPLKTTGESQSSPACFVKKPG